MKKLKIYLNDHEIQITDNFTIKTIKLNSIKDGIIVDKDEFIHNYKDIIVKEFKMKTFSIYQLDIYLNCRIFEYHELYYKSIFEELNFINIKVKSIIDILDNKNYIISNKNSRYLIYNKQIYRLCSLFEIDDSYKYYIFGNDLQDINKDNYYIYMDSYHYIINKIKNIV